MNPIPPKLVISLAISIVFLVILTIFIPSFLPRRVTGSFEYIRKGEELLDRGKQSQAVIYFEKAYESSPDNETIKSSLVYAYSVYSSALTRENKYDEAIKYLDKAYNVTPNLSTIQNLSFAYSEKALYEAEKGSLFAAKKSYTKARQYAAQSDTGSRHLGIMLYNDGVSEFKSGREDLAILCFKESLLIYKDAKTFEVLGDLYNKRAQLKMARFYWHTAASAAANNIALSEKMRKAAKEMALAAKEKEAEIAHFEIRYITDLSIDKDLAAEALEGAYVDIGKDLSYFPVDRTKIFFYSKEDFKNTFNMPYFVTAFYDGSIKMPAPEAYLDKEKFAKYVYHEYTHAIVSAKTNNNCPPWLSEGIAVWEEFKRENVDMKKVAANIHKIPEMSFKFLDASFESDQINHNNALCYVLAYTLVDFILDNWGMKGLHGVLNRLADRQHIVNAIDDEFLISESEFEKRWHDYAVKKFFKNFQ